MLRTALSVAVPLFSLAVAACAPADETDELVGEPDEEVVGDKADATTPGGASQYFGIRPDYRRCAYPMCGGFHIDRLNSTLTTCHDGDRSEACYVPELDWSQSGLTTAQQDKLAEAARRLGDGVHAIVRGRFAARNTTTPMPELGRFIVTEAWVAMGEGASEGVFAKIADNGLRCIAAPCPSLSEKALNSSRRANISEIDFTAGNFGEDAISDLLNDTFAPSGMIVAGERFSFRISGRAGKGRTATQAYRNVANIASGECVRTGCSGHICAEEDMASTCEWRDEYACYQQATCERQPDGQCGFTPTAELAACLADPS